MKSEHHKNSIEEMDQEFARILDDSLNEIYIFDATTLKFLQANRGGRENLGYSMSELLERTPLDIKPEITRDSLEELLLALRSGDERSVVFETVHRRKDGTDYSVEVHVQLSTYHGKPVFVSIVLDTTERIRSEKLIADREACLEAILGTAAEAIITIDDRGICESINHSATRMFGYPPDELIGKNISKLIPSPYREEHDKYIAKYLETGKKNIIGIGREVVGLRKDGVEFPIQLSVSEVQLRDRKLFTGIIQDLTERNESQSRLVQSERLAAVGEAVTSLAHESRNLLQKIQMAVELGRLKSTKHDELNTQLDNIERASDGLHALLGEVRSYAAPIKLELHREAISDLWREAWNLLSHEHNSRDVQFVDETSVAGLEGSFDRFRLVQVFRNLFENSLSACKDPVRISVSVTKTHTESEPAVCICLRDNGPGLGNEQKERIFEPFFTTKSKGTGLGMAIAQRIVEAHGGRIQLGDDYGEGAEFLITLPLTIL